MIKYDDLKAGRRVRVNPSALLPFIIELTTIKSCWRVIGNIVQNKDESNFGLAENHLMEVFPAVDTILFGQEAE